jgi:hypothetical protein
MQHDQTYERERKNLIEEEEVGVNEDETEKDAIKDVDEEDDKDDVVSEADDTPDE